mgnify:CR=1 FL=1
MSDTQKNETVATEQPPTAPVSATEPGSAPASEKKQPFFTPVSYTHLTLPTILRV